MKSTSKKDLLSRQLDLVKSRTPLSKSRVSKKQRDKQQARNRDLPCRKTVGKRKDFKVKAPSRTLKSELSRNLRSIVASIKKVTGSTRGNSPDALAQKSLPDPDQKVGIADAEARDLQERILRKLAKR